MLLDKDKYHIGAMKASLNTIKAGFWEMIAAKIFGKIVRGNDGHTTIEARLFNGKLYLTDYQCKDN